MRLLLEVLAASAIAYAGDSEPWTGESGRGGQAEGLTPAAIAEIVERAARDGNTVEITVVETTRSTLDTTAPVMRTRSERAALAYDLRLQRWPLPWGGESSDGGAALSAKLLGGGGFNLLHAVGAIAFVGAIVPLLRTPRRWGAAAVFAGVGLALIAAGTLHERYPWLLALGAVALVGLLAWAGYESWRRGRASLALGTVARAVEVSGADEVKDAVIALTTERERRAMDAEIDRHKGGRAGRRGRRSTEARGGMEAAAAPNSK